MRLDIDVPYLVEERNTILVPTVGDYMHLLPPEARMINIKGYVFYAVANTPEFNSLLYAAGVPVPSPIYFTDYDWSGVKIYAAQAEMAGLVSSRRRCYNLSALGAGKTIGSLLAADWMIDESVIRRTLVVAPLTILHLVWEAEIEKWFPRLIPVILHGTKEQRRKLIKMNFWNVAIINHDGLNVIKQDLLDANFGLVIIDEAASFRDTRTRRWSVMNEVLAGIPYAVALTGSPTPNAPSDAYGLGKLVTPHRCPKSFIAFRNKVEIEVYPGRFVPRKGAAEIVANLLQPAVRFQRSDIAEKLGVYEQMQKVVLSADQQKALKELKKDAITRFPNGVVSAVNAAVLIGKLLQVCAGAVYTDMKDTVELGADERIDMVRTIIDAAEGKVVIVTPFIHTTEIVCRELAKTHKVAKLIGATKNRERTNIINAFQDRRDPLRAIVANPKIIARGVNLTAANIIVWYAPTFSRETFEQTNGRISRLGQEYEQFIILLTSGSEEDAAYRVLKNKGTMQDAVLEAFDLRMLGDVVPTPEIEDEPDESDAA